MLTNYVLNKFHSHILLKFAENNQVSSTDANDLNSCKGKTDLWCKANEK